MPPGNSQGAFKTCPQCGSNRYIQDRALGNRLFCQRCNYLEGNPIQRPWAGDVAKGIYDRQSNQKVDGCDYRSNGKMTRNILLSLLAACVVIPILGLISERIDSLKPAPQQSKANTKSESPIQQEQVLVMG